MASSDRAWTAWALAGCRARLTAPGRVYRTARQFISPSGSPVARSAGSLVLGGDRDLDVQILLGLDLPLSDLLAGRPPDARLGADGADQLLQAIQPPGSAADPGMHGQ